MGDNCASINVEPRWYYRSQKTQFFSMKRWTCRVTWNRWALMEWPFNVYSHKYQVSRCVTHRTPHTRPLKRRSLTLRTSPYRRSRVLDDYNFAELAFILNSARNGSAFCESRVESRKKERNELSPAFKLENYNILEIAWDRAIIS